MTRFDYCIIYSARLYIFRGFGILFLLCIGVVIQYMNRIENCFEKIY